MTPQLLRTTAVYENGVLRPLGGPIPNLAEGDRVEVVLTRVAPDGVANVAPEADDDYDVLEAMNATRLRQGEHR